MKKLFTTPSYKQWNLRRLRKIETERQKKRHTIKIPKKSAEGKRRNNKGDKISFPVPAPPDFRLIENTNECLLFFREIRSEENVTRLKNRSSVIMSLENVTDIDYGTISILTAISDDLRGKGITLKGDFPKKPECKNFIKDSGFLNYMYDENGKRFPKAEKSDLIFYEKGSGVLSTEDNKNISKMVKNVVNHLMGEENYCLPIKTIILEICGNSIEWSGTDNKQWLFGAKYEDEKVVFTLTDVGKGILKTLHIKFKLKMADVFTSKSDDEILKGAFNQKYGSKTQEANRNKGLPSVKTNFEMGTIHNLKVLTNNVILHFDDETRSKTFDSGSPWFKGTFYQWEMTKDCFNKLAIV